MCFIMLKWRQIIWSRENKINMQVPESEWGETMWLENARKYS